MALEHPTVNMRIQVMVFTGSESSLFSEEHL